MPTLQEIAAVLRSEHCLSRTLEDGTGVVLDLTSSRVLALNGTGMFVLDAILGGAGSLGELVEALTASFEVERATAESDARELVAELGRHLIPDAD